ncbi:hypothetical protein QYE76_016036 [Lolium multiflorum]|uniref:Uncharacterized protein n=1 Tax=Lolium multiflorum TaxID=4521 RepID=A0AAD8U7N6_LOLMU|nr:hypothetical protein QYE76_016036 [Lolium multiflorum]
MMGDDKSARSLSPMGGRDRDLELLIPVSGGSGSGVSPTGDDDVDRTASSSASAALSSSGREVRASRLGFITSVTFIFFVGVFMSSWVGASVLGLGEWIIKRMPLVRHIYNASKQISAAISPDQNKQAFKEAVIIRHPRVGEYAFGFITSSVSLQSYAGQEELYCVYVPTNHLYIGDIFMVNSKDVIRPNLSVREGIEIVVSGGMSMPQILSTLDPHTIHTDRGGASRS